MNQENNKIQKFTDLDNDGCSTSIIFASIIFESVRSNSPQTL